MPPVLTGPISQEKIVELFLAPLEEIGKLARLVLGLSAGAAVLLVNLLAGLQASTWVSAPLVVSVLSFGLAIVACLRVVISLLELRAALPAGLQDESENWQQRAEARVESLRIGLLKVVRVAQFSFLSGIGFAALFVLVLWATRFRMG